MNQKQIVDYYNSTEKYIKNDSYSEQDKTVYTKENDKYQWLVLERKGQNEIEARQTDKSGLIIARDTYESRRNSVKCVDMERLQADGKEWVHFDDDEVNLLYQFGEGGREGTLAMLKAIQPQIKDTETMKVVKQTADKVARLTPESCSSLISCVKNRKLYERDHSIRERLARAKEQSKQTISNGAKSRENSRTGRGEQSLWN